MKYQLKYHRYYVPDHVDFDTLEDAVSYAAHNGLDAGAFWAKSITAIPHGPVVLEGQALVDAMHDYLEKEEGGEG